ncbi:MAG TPA: outer membrane protein transport protein [Candidatus Kapabacteria bacterium]|nr:outer membrane protein transport protein [Candidatus Kapabacteria bacterium]
MFRAPESTMGKGLLLATAAIALSESVYGEGFRNPPPGAFSLARAGGRRAQIDTADAAYHNPANVVDIPGISVEVSPTFVYLKVEHENALTGQSAETTDPFKVLPNAFATFEIIPSKLSAGLAVTTPFGLGNEWEKEGAFGQNGIYRNATAWYTELMTVDVSPTVSWRIEDWIAVGGGLDVYWSQLTLKQFYPAFPDFGLPENPVKARGDGMAVGGNVGITVNVTERQRLSFTYRTPFDIKYEGDLQFGNPPMLPGATQESDFGSEIEFPGIFGFGYGIELTDTIRLESNLEWVEFSRFERLPLDAGSNSPFFPAGIDHDWEDTFTIGIAGDWRFAEHWSWRAGYQFYESPVPDHTFSPTIPDANQHAITTGISFAGGPHRAEFSYGYISYNDRDINNDGAAAIYNGHYEMAVHLFSLGYTYQF